MKYRKYTHIERLGRDEVDGILNGTVYITPKLTVPTVSFILTTTVN